MLLVISSAWKEKVLLELLCLFFLSPGVPHFQGDRNGDPPWPELNPLGCCCALGQSCCLTLDLTQTSLESRVRAGKQPSPPFPGLQGLLFIFLEGQKNHSTCISEATELHGPPHSPTPHHLLPPLTPTSSLFHPTFPQGHPASANGPLAAMMKMDV